MQLDLENADAPAVFESDVCIVGAGIAGLILARKMARGGRTVHLLEAGGLNREARSQDLYAAEMRGVPHRGTTEGRFRTFGGSSTGWAGQLLPYPDEVFEARPAVANVAWPITGADLAPFYPEIQEIMQANAFAFDDSFLRQAGAPAYPVSEAIRVRFSKWAALSRRNLGRTVGTDCLASDKVTVFFHANAIALQFSPSGTEITGVLANNYASRTHTFKARQYVVSTGAIEVSRLLLNSIRLAPQAGNFHDQVGRYFFDHVTCTVGKVAPSDLPVYCRYFAPYYRRGNLHTPRFESSATLQRKLQMLAVMAHFEFEEPEGTGLVIFRRFLHDLQAGRLGRGQKFSTLPQALLGGVRTAYDLKVRGRRFPTPEARLTLRFDVEQKPDAESRLLLSDRCDQLGMPQLIVDWKHSEDETRSLHAFADYMDAYLKSAGLHLQWSEGLREHAAAWGGLGVDIFHHMGGARMGVSPALSVVDRHLRVHDVANLYIASCAVYPTGGSSNPTYSLMALTLRLAEHLRGL